MTGTIKTYAEEKKYGFIKGDDGKDYFFHNSAVDKKDKICEDALVHFEQKATPKGYSAVKIKMDSQIGYVKYVAPDTIYTSKETGIKGWETIDKASWYITGTSRGSPDEAKAILLQRAKKLKINALTEMEYRKTTGSEAGTGKGIYYYSIHHFLAVPTNIGKKNLKGTVEKRELEGLDNYLLKVKEKLQEQTHRNRMNAIFIYAIITVIISTVVFISLDKFIPIVLFVPPIIFLALYFWGGYTNDDDWLEKLD